MPPRPTPPPAGKPRRRSSPAMPGSWIWLVILGTVLLMLLVSSFNDRNSVDYSDFIRLLFDKEASKHIMKVTMVGQDQIKVEVDDPEALPQELRERLHNSKNFWTYR